MSESRKAPMEFLLFLLFGALGLAVTAGCMAGAAQLMAAQGCSGSVAAPLSTVCVCMGGLCSGWAAAFRRRECGLLIGLLQGILPAGLIGAAALLNHAAEGLILPLRILAVVLCSCMGGALGVALRRRRRAV